MLKIMGAILILSASGVMGILKYREIYEDIEFAEGIKNGFLYIKSEVNLSSVLSRGLKNAVLFSGSGAYIFKRTYEIIKEDKTFEYAFLTACENVRDPRMSTILNEVGKRLGKSDTKGETELIDETVKRIDIYINQRKEELKTKGDFFKKTGFILGAAAVILLI